ncbi:MAG TPA: DegV family protein [Chloroflexota bacterium]|nr:DegV family protein [Chloroflexota bacterium]
MTVAIVADSTADFPNADPSELDVTLIPLTVHWGRDVLRDRVDVTTGEFYARLRTDPNLPKTSAPPIGIFEEVYRERLARCDAVISLHIASAFSSTHSVALAAARAVDPRRIHVIDSASTSVGLGWLVERAAELAATGLDADGIVRAVQESIPRVRLFLTLETLEYLQRGGRIGRAQAFVGALLNVKPVLQILDGTVVPVERVRTRAASLRRIADLAERAGAKERMAIVHGDSAAEAEALRDLVAASHPELPIGIAEIGAVVATYTGPGIIGIGCLLASQ